MSDKKSKTDPLPPPKHSSSPNSQKKSHGQQKHHHHRSGKDRTEKALVTFDSSDDIKSLAKAQQQASSSHPPLVRLDSSNDIIPPSPQLQNKNAHNQQQPQQQPQQQHQSQQHKPNQKPSPKQSPKSHRNTKSPSPNNNNNNNNHNTINNNNNNHNLNNFFPQTQNNPNTNLNNSNLSKSTTTSPTPPELIQSFSDFLLPGSKSPPNILADKTQTQTQQQTQFISEFPEPIIQDEDYSGLGQILESAALDDQTKDALFQFALKLQKQLEQKDAKMQALINENFKLREMLHLPTAHLSIPDTTLFEREAASSPTFSISPENVSVGSGHSSSQQQPSPPFRMSPIPPHISVSAPGSVVPTKLSNSVNNSNNNNSGQNLQHPVLTSVVSDPQLQHVHSTTTPHHPNQTAKKVEEEQKPVPIHHSISTSGALELTSSIDTKHNPFAQKELSSSQGSPTQETHTNNARKGVYSPALPFKGHHAPAPTVNADFDQKWKK